ncbi:hypothetical protein [Rhodoblastus sp.]|jgi:hypothetical protein|uniref:hypothetical protein n=1 Tax=Rhodoblastus sp. TaxID=1962975 RepID=UPI0025F07499|nr:hypothetical protein [Rhodoblastus sp.]
MGIATKAILIGRHDVGQVITALSASGLIEKATIDYPRQGGYDTFSCVEPAGARLQIWVFYSDAVKDDYKDVFEGEKSLVDLPFNGTSPGRASGRKVRRVRSRQRFQRRVAANRRGQLGCCGQTPSLGSRRRKRRRGRSLSRTCSNAIVAN